MVLKWAVALSLRGIEVNIQADPVKTGAAMAAGHGVQGSRTETQLLAGLLDHELLGLWVVRLSHGVEMKHASRFERLQGARQQARAVMGEDNGNTIKPLAASGQDLSSVTLEETDPAAEAAVGGKAAQGTGVCCRVEIDAHDFPCLALPGNHQGQRAGARTEHGHGFTCTHLCGDAGALVGRAN